MTYDWDNVKEEACRLYTACWCLDDIKDKLAREKGFDAKTRVWRRRLNEWKVKKTSKQTCRRDRKQLVSIRRPCEQQRTSLDLASPNPESCISRHQHPTEAIPSSSEIEHGTLLLPIDVDKLPEQSHFRASDGPEQVIRTNKQIPEPGLKQPVHFGFSVNERDVEDRNAYELAIIYDRTARLSNLLEIDRYSSLPHSRNAWLHLAIKSGSSLEMCELILSYWKKWFRPYHVEMAVETVLASLEDHSLVSLTPYLYTVLERSLQKSHLLQPISADHVNLYRRFLQCSSFHTNSHSATTEVALRCLRLFLTANFSPFEPCNTNGLNCQHQTPCQSLAAILILHCEDASSARMLLESFSITSFGSRMFSSLLAVYSDAGITRCRRNIQLELIEISLRRHRDHSNRADLLSLALRVLLRKPAHHVLPVVGLLRNYGFCNAYHAYDHPNCDGPLHLLTLMPEPLIWRLADLIINPLESRRGLEPFDWLFTHDLSTDYAAYATLDNRMLAKFTPNTHLLHQCIVYVVSRITMANTDIGTVTFRLREALDMRREVGLSDLSADLGHMIFD